MFLKGRRKYPNSIRCLLLPCVAAALLFLCLETQAHAQSSLADVLELEKRQTQQQNKLLQSTPPKLPFDPKIMEELARQNEIDPTSKFFATFMRSPKKHLARKQEPAAIIRHVKGKQGNVIDFKSLQTVPEIQAVRLSAEEKKAVKAQEQALTEKLSEKIQLSTCTSAARSHSQVAAPDASIRGQGEIDFLFLDPSQVPSQSDTSVQSIFGKKVQLKVLTEDNQGGQSLAKSFNLDCLPSRFRITKGRIYRESGEYALRNYDSNPHGQGVLHPVMKDVIEGNK